ncbi:hypothetical protein ES707_04749 [subsurface metagenome]
MARIDTVVQIHNFIIKKLVTKLKNDCKKLRILTEGDLQGVIYYFLRAYIQKQSKKKVWRILNKPYIRSVKKRKKGKVSKIGTFSDIVVFRKNRPKIVIELKEANRIKESSINYDLWKIKRFKKSGIKKGYLILLTQTNEHDRIEWFKNIKIKKGKFSVHTIMINPRQFLNKQKLNEWKKKRQLFAKIK